MDIATVIGLIVGTVLVLGSIVIGGAPAMFVDIPSVMIVVGGTYSTALIRFGLKDVLNSTKVGMNTLLVKISAPTAIIQETISLANIARKSGLIALEQQPITDAFLKKAVMFCVDGHDADFICEMLKKEINLTTERHELGKKVFVAMGDAAPAFGMIGTLIGLVQMLGNMSDPASIGPSMAVALLTTLYGALIANLICLPMADKLALRSQEEERNRRLIVEGVMAILKGLNPRVMEEFLQAFLAPKERTSVEKK